MLEELDNTSIEIQQQWLRFMLERVGHSNLGRLLDYYESLGWINEDVSNSLLDLARTEKRYRGNSWTLSAKEHRISMLYIEKLMGKKVDNSLLSIPEKSKARRSSTKKTDVRPRAGYLEGYQREFDKMKFMIHRKEITIKNLEQGLEDRDVEISMLREKLRDLEERLNESIREEKKNKIYREVLDENIRLRKG